MVRATKFSLGLASIVVLGLLSTGVTQLSAQGVPPKREGPAAGQERGEAARKARQEQREKLKQGVATAKVSLPAAMTTVETETKGKVYRVSYSSNRDGKFEINVGVIVGDKFGTVIVDAESGKAEAVKFDDDRAEGREGGREGREPRDGSKKEREGE